MVDMPSKGVHMPFTQMQPTFSVQSECNVLRCALVGYGYWGPLLLRNLIRQQQTEVAVLVDLADERLSEARRNHPGLAVTRDLSAALADDIDAVVIATPLSSHFVLAHQALKRNKHVLVEKPLTASAREAQILIDLARERQRILMVGHTFEYSPEVDKLRRMVQDGELGRIYAINSSRLNLGIFRKDADVLWDLAPHDISMINFVLQRDPLSVQAHGSSYVTAGLTDISHIDLTYSDGITAHVHVSWLHPNKERRFMVVGDRRMVCYDDTAGNEKIKIYDRGVERPDYATTYGEFQLSYRYGEIQIPFIPGAEPLAVECQDFVEAIRTGRSPRSDGMVGLRVVRVIEAAHESLQRGGASVNLAL
jgi:predicted dehydrogenase